MTERQPAQEAIEHLLDRMAALSERITGEAEEQVHRVDQRARDWLERGEAATDRLIEMIDKDVRAQITTLRREIDELAARVADLRKAALPRTSTAKRSSTKTRAKKTTAKKTTTRRGAGKTGTATTRSAKKTARRR